MSGIFRYGLWSLLRGGEGSFRLDEQSESELKALRPDEEIPAWAFRFLQSLRMQEIDEYMDQLL